MTKRSQLMTVGMALLLTLSVLAPTVAAAETTVTVETDPATEVTDRSATLNGNLTELSGADNATVQFEYWIEGDRENSTNTTAMTVGTGAFSWGVSDLSNDTTYVYVAHAEANGTTATGEQVTFTTLAEAPLGVDTLGASDVTNSSATLNGELAGLGDADNATVSLEYWVEGDRENSTTTGETELDAAGTFDESVSDLSNDTTYVYVAHAEADGTTVTGEQVTFTPGATEGDEDGPFGQRVAAFVQSLLDSDDLEEENVGQAVSEFVTENNPGADNRPDHAGPPEDRGNDGEDGDERGPPEDRGNDGEDGDERGPPENAGPPDDDDGEDDEDDEDDEDSDS